MVEANIVNVVATADLDEKIDLEDLGKLKEVIHDSMIYGGRVAYFRSPSLKGTVSIFATGKMISVGTKSEAQAIRQLEGAKEFLVEKRFVKRGILKPKIQNIVVVANFGRNINLEQLATKLNMIYEPEQFPGGILRIKEPHRVTVLLFASGKAVLTGLKNSSQIDPTIQKVLDLTRAN